MNYKKSFLELEKTIVKGGHVTHEDAIDMLAMIPEVADFESTMAKMTMEEYRKEIEELEAENGKLGIISVSLGLLVVLSFVGNVLQVVL